jgi:hypothetical protein
LSTYTGFKQNSDKVLPVEATTNSERLPHQDWCKVLATYSRSEATFEKDGLVAMKELAEKLSEILDDEWIAELWKKTLPGDLMWKVRKRRRTNKPALSLEANYRTCTTTSSKKLVESSRELSTSIVVLCFRTRRH